MHEDQLDRELLKANKTIEFTVHLNANACFIFFVRVLLSFSFFELLDTQRNLVINDYSNSRIK